jgi:hypothetical protein
MDNLDTKSPTQNGENDLQAQFEALRQLVLSILVLVVVISGTLNIYLLRQWRTTTRDLAGLRPQAEQMMAEYQKRSGPLMNDFIKKITEYGRTNPDFAPILAKYGLKPNAPTGSLPVSPSPLPVPPAPKK